MEEKLGNLLYINEDIFKEKNKLRKKIYEKIIYLKDYSKLDEREHFLFQESKELFENENEDKDEEFRKLVDKYYNLNNLVNSINFYINELKKV